MLEKEQGAFAGFWELSTGNKVLDFGEAVDNYQETGVTSFACGR